MPHPYHLLPVFEGEGEGGKKGPQKRGGKRLRPASSLPWPNLFLGEGRKKKKEPKTGERNIGPDYVIKIYCQYLFIHSPQEKEGKKGGKKKKKSTPGKKKKRGTKSRYGRDVFV